MEASDQLHILAAVSEGGMRYPLKRSWMGPRVGLIVLEQKKSLFLPKFKPETFHPITSPYNDYAIPAPNMSVKNTFPMMCYLRSHPVWCAN